MMTDTGVGPSGRSTRLAPAAASCKLVIGDRSGDDGIPPCLYVYQRCVLTTSTCASNDTLASPYPLPKKAAAATAKV